MSLRVINEWESPPGYWRFPVPETGKLVGPFPAFTELMNALRRHYESNQLLAPADLESKVMDWMCHQLHPSLCESSDGRERLLTPVKNRKGLVAKFNSVVSGTMTIGEWFIKGRLMDKLKLVDAPQATARGTVCATCPHNIEVGRCAPCVAGRMTKAIERVVGNSKTPVDSQLNACNLCGCSLKAKVWFPLDLLRKHMTEQHLSEFPAFCWLVTEAK